MSVPTWRLREELRRKAESIIRGRADFERHVGRLSTMPLQQIELVPRDVLQLLDEDENRAAGFDEGVRAMSRALQGGNEPVNPYRNEAEGGQA